MSTETSADVLMTFVLVCGPDVLLRDLISSTTPHQSTERVDPLDSKKRVHDCSIDERIGAGVDERDRADRV